MTYCKIATLLLAATHLAVLPGLAQAQASDLGGGFDQAFDHRGMEARLSFTIPLGDSPDATKTAPRFNLGLRNYSQNSPQATDWMLRGEPEFKDVRLGFTLGETPQFLLNDEPFILQQTDEQANIGTAGKIGLGVAAVAVTGVAVIAVLFATCNDCGSD